MISSALLAITVFLVLLTALCIAGITRSTRYSDAEFYTALGIITFGIISVLTGALYMMVG